MIKQTVVVKRKNNGPSLWSRLKSLRKPEMIHLSNKDITVRQIVSAAFPDYNGNKISCTPCEKVEIRGTNWDSGSKRDYVMVRLSDMVSLPVPDSHFMDNSDRQYKIPPGFVVVCRQYSGVNQYIYIYAESSTITPMIGVQTNLSRNEKIVLAATRSLKSSYGGIKDYRFHEANYMTGITSIEWSEAKSLLITAGLLNKAGAITIEGKNAIGSTDLWTLKAKDMYNLTECKS